MGDPKSDAASAEADGLSRRTLDAWENLTTGLGRANRDKRMGGRAKAPPVFIDEISASDLYHGDDLSQQMADVPPKEMLRQWVTLKVEELSDGTETRTEEEEKENSATLARITKEHQQKAQSLNMKAKLFEAMVWSRVYGGSLMFLGVDDGLGGDPRNLEKPLRMERIRSFTFLKIFNRWETSIAKRYQDERNPKFGEPEHYRLSPKSNSGLSHGFSNIPIHETRFIRFDGVLTSRQRRLENDSWSDSIYIRMQELLTDYGLAWTGIAHLIQDFSQAIFKMRGLKAALASDKDNLVIDRMLIMDLCRSLARAVPLDADGEDFERKQTPMTGLPEMMDRWALRMASAAKMPATLLFGQSPAGLSATGESDIRLFYDRLRSDQETDLRPSIELLFQLIFLSQDGPTKGKEPEQWSFTFNALWQMTQKEEADLRKVTADTDSINISHGIYSPEEASQSHYGGDEFSIDITLDQETRGQIAEVDARLAGMSEQELQALEAGPEAVPPAPTAAEPEPPAPTGQTSATPGGDDPVIEAAVALNGAQVTALLDVINRVANKLLPREVGVNVIANAFNLEPALVEKMFGVVGSTFFIEQQAPRQFQGNEDAWHADVVEKRGSKWVVLSKDGKVLGTHDTEEEALKQLRAVEAAKAARGDTWDPFYLPAVSPLRHTRFDQALHHTHWDPEQNDFMGPETIDPVTGDHIHERPDGTKSLPAPTGAPHRHETGAGPSGEAVPWFSTKAEEREHFLSQMAMTVDQDEPAFCDKDAESYDAARCEKWRQSRQS